MTDLLKIAAEQIGVKEIPGDKHNKKILDYATEAGFKGISTDETPWCSIFANWCCNEAKLQRSHKANARSWLSVGTPTSDPEPGNIVVFWRESPSSWKGHVGFFLGFNKNQSKVFVLGGNQKNCVSIQAYKTERVLGYRILSATENVAIPETGPTLKLGVRGDNVKLLQTLLKETGYNCGSADGIFGQKTEAALKKFQRDEEIRANGVYTADTKAKFEEIYPR